MNMSENEAINAQISEKANSTRFAQPTDTEQALARAVLIMAANASMPDTFWQSDSRIVAACGILGWTVESGREWAFGVAPSRPTWDELFGGG